MNGQSLPSGNRIAAVDGLRAVAVLGVIWAHVWAFCGTPKLSLGHVGSFSLDLNRLISMFGTGVDLFFVISGFCMYLMVIRQQTRWSWHSYGLFLKRRWLRLAPAFYTACLICVIGLKMAGMPLFWRGFLVNLAFIQIWFPHLKALASPFWSLATEWHFYMILPFFLAASFRWGFGRVMGFLFLACMAFRIWVYFQSDLIIKVWSIQLPPRLIEFGWGILIAHWTEQKRTLPRLLKGNGGFLLGLLVMFIGRLLLTKEVSHLAGRWSAWPHIFWEPILTCGYALMLWNVVTSPSVFANILSSSPAQAIGRWSYSLYLWHWWPCYVLSTVFVRKCGATLEAQYLALTLLLLVIIPWSWLSYKWLEAPYFNHWRVKEPAP